MSGTRRIQHEMKAWQAKGTMKSLELAAASAHVAFSDTRSPSALGSLALSPASPSRMAASSKSGQVVGKGVKKTEGLPVDRPSLPRRRADEDVVPYSSPYYG
eukprot:15416274-Alexandrium_andersonii.AAC.1